MHTLPPAHPSSGPCDTAFTSENRGFETGNKWMAKLTSILWVKFVQCDFRLSHTRRGKKTGGGDTGTTCSMKEACSLNGLPKDYTNLESHLVFSPAYEIETACCLYIYIYIFSYTHNFYGLCHHCSQLTSLINSSVVPDCIIISILPERRRNRRADQIGEGIFVPLAEISWIWFKQTISTELYLQNGCPCRWHYTTSCNMILDF